MSNWSHNLILICPISHVETEKRISRSLDPDIGGYAAFESFAGADGLQPATHAVYGTPCHEAFIQTINALMADAPTLKAAVDADYAARWPGEVVPTLAECQAFLAGLQLFINTSWDDALAQAGLVLITQEAV